MEQVRLNYQGAEIDIAMRAYFYGTNTTLKNYTVMRADFTDTTKVSNIDGAKLLSYARVVRSV